MILKNIALFSLIFFCSFVNCWCFHILIFFFAQMPPTILKPAGIANLSAIATCLRNAFKQDPAYAYFVNCDKNDQARQDYVGYALFYYTMSAALLSGSQVHAIVDPQKPNDILACAAWFPPGVKFNSSPYMMLRSGMWRLSYKFGPESKKRFLKEYMEESGKIKKEIVGDSDIWYLMFLGVAPQAQGQGHARTLINYVTDQADVTRHRCYLESSTPDNAMKVYGKYGFVEKARLLSGDKTSYTMPCMLREPAELQ